MTTVLPKLESQVGDDWRIHRYRPIFVREKTTGPERLVIAASERGADLLLQLAAVLGEPFSLLYVLLTPRTGSEEGRYQSPWMDRAALNDLFADLAAFWDQDGRHHVWLFSGPERATLVYDQHNVIYAYGPLEDFVRLLEASGYVEASELSFPAPHRHSFHGEFDVAEHKLVTMPGWTRFPLQAGDEW
jgi:hypothetical protein